jgi:hypothetical protein
MIFRVSRASRMPLVLEEEELHYMFTLELQGRWVELDDYIKELKEQDGPLEMLFECHTLADLKIFLTTVDPNNQYTLDFQQMSILIEDGGREC